MVSEHERRAAPRFPASLILRDPIHCLAFGLGTGLAPRAPGTFGTLPGVALWWAMQGLPPGLFLAICAVLAAAGVWITGISSRRLGVHDHPGIVFDEIVAFPLAAFPLLPALGWWQHGTLAGLVLAFALFRLMDIWKPWPIRALDRGLHGGLGIMMDDIGAGIAAGAVLASACVVH